MEKDEQTNTSLEKINQLDLGRTSKLKLFVWKTRRGIRDALGGKDVLEVKGSDNTPTEKVREVYRLVESFMSKHLPGLASDTPVDVARKMVHDKIVELGYTIVEEDQSKPWGAYYRMDSTEADRFITEFFPGLSVNEAKLGRDDVELSPKFLLVAPKQRLSWQYHDRRAERWRFLTSGSYFRSSTDEQGDQLQAAAGEVVQFAAGERHRLCANIDSVSYTLVAEIWQHTDPSTLSTEEDIVRLQDDYKR
jgi:mannose-6-phosphate isomerase-like protein (cupin superfamily)